MPTSFEDELNPIPDQLLHQHLRNRIIESIEMMACGTAFVGSHGTAEILEVWWD